MTVNTVARIIDYVSNGSTLGPFDIPFRFLANDELLAFAVDPDDGVATTLELSADYTVTGADDDDGGALTLTVALAAGTVLRIKGATERHQPMDYTANDTFPAESHERALDRQAMIAQELADTLDDTVERAFLAPIGEEPGQLPALADRKGKVLGFHSTTGAPIAVANDAVAIGEDIEAAAAHEAAAQEAAEMARLTATQGLPRCRFVDLNELGLAGYPDFEGFVYFTDGTHLYPMLPVGECKGGWLWGGQFADNPDDGIFYASVNPSYMKDPTRQGGTVNTYYLKPSAAGGSDAADGLTSGTAWATRAKVIADAVRPALILCVGDAFGSGVMGGGSSSDCGGLRFLGVPVTAGVKPGIFLMRESISKATFNWQSNGDGSFYCQEADGTIPPSVKSSPGLYHLTVRDAHGAPLRYKPAASEAAARATPNSFFNDTSTTPDKWTVHPVDGVEPDPFVTLAYIEAFNAYNWLPDDGEDVVLENFFIPVNTGLASSTAIYGRAKDITVPGPHVAHTGGVHLIDCVICGSSGNGSINQDVNGYHFNTWFRDCRSDAVSGGTFYTYGNVNTGDRTLEGRHLRVIFFRGGAYDIGENDFVDQPALSGSANLLTAHSQVWALGIDLEGRGFDGCPFALVGASKALLLNCFVNDVLISTPSQAALNLGAPPKALYWADGPSDGVPGIVTEVFMAYCGGEAGGDGYTFAATRGAIIKYARHRGPTTVLPGQSGTVTNVSA